ncbi:MAG: amidohydrolase [Solobacterium sp.]|nr:amidohydrolase [Solobacterium sp.]
MRQIYHNGTVYGGQDTAFSGFIVENGIITHTGPDVETMVQKEDEVIDLEGRFVCAGFNDSHMHLLNYGKVLYAAQLHEHTSSLAELLAYLKEYGRTHEKGWLTGRGWNQDYFADTDRMPDRHDLDTVSLDRPVMITRACGHVVSVNSEALALAGIDEHTPDPSGGRIGRKDGVPDGILYENAISLLDAVLPVPDEEQLRQMILLAAHAVNSCGITSVQSDDYGVFPLPYTLINKVYQDLEKQGKLTVRVYEQCNLPDVHLLKDFIAHGRVTGTMFATGPLKLVADGSLGGRTAHLSRPYHDRPDTCGFSLFSQQQLAELVETAHSAGMQCAVHAIGDACLDEVLSAIEKAITKNPRKDHRHGIVHCQISRPDQLVKIRDLDLHVYAQSIFLDYDNHIVEKRVGKELAASSYSWKTLMASGVRVSNGSDCPVELPDVMKGMQCAVTRESTDGCGPYLREQAFTVAEALDSYTVNGAYASFQEHAKGRIAPGYMADFTILDQDPFAVSSHDLHAIKVHAVYLNGEKVYENRQSDAVL